MSLAIVTGSAGLIGSESSKFLHEKGLDVIGIDNNMREYFFGKDGSTIWNQKNLINSLPRYKHLSLDIRNEHSIMELFSRFKNEIKLIVHAAAQPSHDWAVKEPLTDFGVNAVATLNLLEATRKFCPDAVFIFTSTSKVYGDLPNTLPLIEKETRFEIAEDHPFYSFGIDESFSIDQSLHSIFGASKVAADVMVQEYGKYFGLKTVCFRGGCLTGPSHSGAELHGFLSYLVKCAMLGRPYKIFGYKGKQVRDNIHSKDLINSFWHYFENPIPGRVYNIGASRKSSCSILEAISLIEEISEKEVQYTLEDQPRIGDHIWWISDNRTFQKDYPKWRCTFNLKEILEEMIDNYRERIAKNSFYNSEQTLV